MHYARPWLIRIIKVEQAYPRSLLQQQTATTPQLLAADMLA